METCCRLITVQLNVTPNGSLTMILTQGKLNVANLGSQIFLWDHIR